VGDERARREEEASAAEGETFRTEMWVNPGKAAEETPAR